MRWTGVIGWVAAGLAGAVGVYLSDAINAGTAWVLAQVSAIFGGTVDVPLFVTRIWRFAVALDAYLPVREIVACILAVLVFELMLFGLSVFFKLVQWVLALKPI